MAFRSLSYLVPSSCWVTWRNSSSGCCREDRTVVGQAAGELKANTWGQGIALLMRLCENPFECKLCPNNKCLCV